MQNVQWPKSFPIELNAYIFQLTVLAESNTNLHRFPAPSRTAAPLTLTWVCSNWRRLALSMPNLWTSLSLGSKGRRPGKDINILRLFLSRCGDTLPISFALNYEPLEPLDTTFVARPLSESYLGGIRQLARELVPLRHRWRVMSLHTLIYGALEPFLDALSLGAHNLSYLRISTKYIGFYGVQHALDLTSCPMLETVRILSPMVFSDPSAPQLYSLQTLEMKYCQSQTDALTWLSACPNLRKLNIRLYAARPTESPLAREIILSHLEEVSLTCFYDDSDPALLLNSIVAPQLVSLSLIMCDLIPLSGGLTSWDCVSQLLRRSGGHRLKELGIVDTPMTPQEIVHVLSLTPNIGSLTLGGSGVTDDVLRALMPPSSSQMIPNSLGGLAPTLVAPLQLCPNLDSLELHEIPGSTRVIADLVTFRSLHADERKTGSHEDDQYAQLKNLTLSGFPYFDELECMPAGLKIRLKTSEP